MRRIIWLAMTGLCIIVFSQTAAAEDTAKDEAIKELLQVMKTIDNLGASMETMKKSIKSNSPYFLKEVKVILGREVGEEEVKRAAELYRQEDFGANRLFELFQYKFNLDRIENEVMMPVYRQHYSKKEIEELTTFYSSELGQKTLRLNPSISHAITTKTRDISQMALNQAKEELAYELQKLIEEKKAE